MEIKYKIITGQVFNRIRMDFKAMKESAYKSRPTNSKDQYLGVIKFGMLGLANVVSCIVLQTILIKYTDMKPSLLAACVQIWNLLSGYILYGKVYFGSRLRSKDKFMKYICLNLINYILNWIVLAIPFMSVSKEIKTLIIVPVIACMSYYIQKNIIFND